jgi:hypothetical protein
MHHTDYQIDGSLLDTEDFGSSCSLLHYSSEHTSSVTGLLTTSGIANSTFISSSLDATCKVPRHVLASFTIHINLAVKFLMLRTGYNFDFSRLGTCSRVGLYKLRIIHWG